MAPAFTSICSRTLMKMASMLLRIDESDSCTYDSNYVKVAKSFDFVSWTELRNF